MNKIIRLSAGVAVACAAGFFFSSCTNSTSPNTGVPYNVMALSKNASTISIKWTRDASDNTADTIIVSSTSGTTATPTSSTATTADLTGLSEGTQYTIMVASTGGRSASITWMTATRTSGLQLYQFSSHQLSGLQLNGGGGTAQVVSAVSANIAGMDFYLEDVAHDPSITTTSGLSFEGAQFLDGSGLTWRNSFIDTGARYVVGGLDADYSSSFSTQFSRISNGNAYDIPDNGVDYRTYGSRVLLVKTQDGNFAKVEIVPDPSTGKLYSGSGSNKYITVNVSYQPVANQPYAARAHQNFGVRPSVRISAH